jgi:glycine/D-amino acid oxidase-like deaminating enzyme
MHSQGLHELLTAPSYWQARLNCRQVHIASLPLETDVAVIGAGIGGLAAAQRALEAGLSVTVLEANQVGSGGSGRNSGFVVPIPARHTPDSLRRCVGSGSGALMAAIQEAVHSVFERVPSEGQRGWLQTFIPAVSTHAQALAAGWRALGVDVALLEGEALTHAIGTPRYTTALHYPSGGAVDPMALLHQLTNTIYHQGGSIIEHCPVVRITRKGRGIILETPTGCLHAGRVFIAGNAYGTGASQTTRRAVGRLPLTLATFAMPSPTASSPLPFSDTHKDMWFARWLDDRTVLTGCFALALQRSTKACSDLLQERLDCLYSHRPDAPFQQWAGWVGLTPNGLPKVHDGDGRIISWSGCNGCGIALSLMMGRTLMEQLCGLSGRRLSLTRSGWQPSNVLAWLAQAVIARDRYRQRRALLAY